MPWRTIDVNTGLFRDATPEEELALQAWNFYCVAPKLALEETD